MLMDFDNAQVVKLSRTKGAVKIQKKHVTTSSQLNYIEESNIPINYLKVKKTDISGPKEFNSSYQEASFEIVSNPKSYKIKNDASPSKNKSSKNFFTKISYGNIIFAFIVTLIVIVLLVLVVILSLVLIQRTKSYVKNKDTTTKEAFFQNTTSNISTKICKNGFLKSSCEECGLSVKQPNARIIGGIEAIEHSWPSMAFIYFEYRFSGINSVIKRRSFCGGTLINPDTILTAAHCFISQVYYHYFNHLITVDVVENEFHPTYESMYTVYLGMHNLSGIFDRNQVFGEKFKIKKFIIHPEYDSKNYLNDIGIIRLEKKATLGDKIQLSCLPDSDVENYPDISNVDSYAVGWGATVNQGLESYFLRNVKLTIYEGKICNNVQIGLKKNWVSQICAGEILGGKDTCQGDSGGPLFIKNEIDGVLKFVLVGITSYGEDCALPNLPGIYTRVNAFKYWISSVVKK